MTEQAHHDISLGWMLIIMGVSTTLIVVLAFLIEGG